MRDRGRWHKIKYLNKDNAGSAIVTVLVVVAFITILATIMLYVSGSNFQMKAADYRTKESFYYAETPVEELRAQLVEDVQVAFARAYANTASEYADLLQRDPSLDLVKNTYLHCFCEEMNDLWRTRSGVVDKVNGDNRILWTTGIESVISQPSAGGGSWTLSPITPSSGMEEKDIVTESGTSPRLIMQGVEFTYVSPNGYTSIISTDFCILIPEVQWPGSYVPSGTDQPDKLDFSDCVYYMNWTKK